MESFPETFLNYLEKQEERLLAWGFYDNCFSINEVEAMIAEASNLAEEWQVLKEDDWTITEFVDELVEQNLLCRASPTDSRVRSRFAETVRLMARLRQIFSEGQWDSGANLVADIKLCLKSRKYPQRDQSPESCWEAMEQHAANPGLQKQLFDRLAQDSNTRQRFSFSGFQKRAFAHILSKYKSPGATGSVVCAGTGSGKTKAFYIPAILAAASEVDETPFTKIIAIYPRNVLLADQFREAVSEVLKLNETLAACGKRPFTLGAFLGQTPHNDSSSFEKRTNSSKGKVKDERTSVERFNGWRPVGDGFALPFLKSPLDPSADLVWRDADRKAGRTCLYRVGGDSNEPDVPDRMLLLTRDALRKTPPDILFLSAEMLNRELGNPEWSKTLGIRETSRRPRLLLLDEVHAYEGLSGAQHAWVLRRWRHAVRGGSHGSDSLHVVALSATLKDAADHLARVAGLKAADVSDFRPSVDEYEQEGREYNLAIKGDPAEGKSLLSTSIQTGMLLARSLTPRSNIPNECELPVAPEKMYGNKVFGFTDNLDSINRWFSDMVDAEQGRMLARYRLDPTDQIPPPSREEIQRRYSLGQIWKLATNLGYDLNRPLQIGKCSSQDPGVGQNVDMIIATSSLEVGFDDPTVGAIMQHKKPNSMASFIQRKGRAGRLRGSRPWTVIVLSDYGKDRYAFQHAEKLFEPELDTITLPCNNQFVLRSQAAYFLLDWLGRRVKGGSPYGFLKGHTENRFDSRDQTKARYILNDLLLRGKEWQLFRKEALDLFSHRTYGPDGDLTRDQIESLFWEQPRPLLLEVVPTLLRQLETGWGVANPEKPAGASENQGIRNPLPEFLPGALFASLDVAEAKISFQSNTGAKEDEFLDVSRVLPEECPGNVSKRYATGNRELGYWHAYSVNLQAGRNQASVSQLYRDVMDLGVINGTRVLQPNLVEVANHPPDVLDTSSARWVWSSELDPFGRGYDVPLFKTAPWKDVITSCRAYLHRDQSGIVVTRYASSLRFEVRRRSGTSDLGSLELISENGAEGRSEAVGFQRRVDGIAIHLNKDHLNNAPELSPHLMARFRTDYYRHCLLNSDDIPIDVNSFQREWLWQTSLGMLTATALKNDCSLEQAQQQLESCRSQAADRVLGSIFHIRDGAQNDAQGRTAETLRALWQDQSLVDVIKRLESLLWTTPDEAFSWIRQRYIATLAHAFRVTATSLDPQVNDSDLSLDVVSDEPGGTTIYLTETQSGGLGVIDRIMSRINMDPNRFHNGMLHSLTRCPRHRTSTYLNSVLDALHKDDSLRDVVKDLRSAQSYSENEGVRERLRASLVSSGFDITRDRFVSLMMHIFAPGSSAQTDVIARSVNADWHVTEEHLQIGIDSRVFAYCSLAKDEYRTAIQSHLQSLHQGISISQHQMYTSTERFLYPTCQDSCPECLQETNWYSDFGTPSRELGLIWLGIESQRIEIHSHEDDWVNQVRETIFNTGVVEVAFADSLADIVTGHLHELFSNEVEDELLFYPISMQAAERDGNVWVLKLAIKDFVHA